MATREHDNDQPASPWSRTSVQLSALFLRMLLVVGIAIAIFHHGSQHAHDRQRSRYLSGRHSARRDNDQRLPRTWPVLASRRRPTGALRELSAKGRDWQPVGTMSVPQSSTLGPQHVQNGINVCFAHNPSGALLAAMNLIRGGYDADLRAAGIRQLVDRRALRCHDGAGESKTVTVACRSPVTSTTAISPTEAVVDVVLRHQQGGLSVFQAPMRWTGNDWKYVFPPEGPISSTLNGSQVEPPYVAWSPF